MGECKHLKMDICMLHVRDCIYIKVLTWKTIVRLQITNATTNNPSQTEYPLGTFIY